jgi:anti-sigma B factor antagonist
MTTCGADPAPVGPPDVDAWIDGGRAVVRVSGELDVYSAPKLRAVLAGLPAPARYWVAVDLAGVTFMDSSGLGALVGAVRRARGGRGAVCVVGAREHVLRTLRITGLTRLIQACADLDEAFEYLDGLL